MKISLKQKVEQYFARMSYLIIRIQNEKHTIQCKYSGAYMYVPCILFILSLCFCCDSPLIKNNWKAFNIDIFMSTYIM